MNSFSETVIRVVEKTKDCVVHVATVEHETDGYHAVPHPGIGSGVIISEDGFIITNNHVISGADRITVTLKDGRKFPAKLIGANRNVDIALLKIAIKELSTAIIGDSDRLKVGQLVVAIGNPFGFTLRGSTVTAGIVSAVNQTFYTDRGASMGMIQTDAAINPGNSGGALVDEEGKLIGINTAGMGGEGNVGVNFAVPINKAMSIVEGFISITKSDTPWTGITGLDLTEQARRYYRIVNGGIMVMRVELGSPADKAGLKSGDLILNIEGELVNSMRDFQDKMDNIGVRREMNINGRRGTREFNVTMVL